MVLEGEKKGWGGEGGVQCSGYKIASNKFMFSLRDISFLYDVAAKEKPGRGGDTARSKVRVHV